MIQPNDLFALESPVYQALTESLAWGVDTTAWATGDETPSAATAALFDEYGVEVEGALSGDPVITDMIVAQEVDGSVLTPGVSYVLALTFTLAGGKTPTAYVQINCVSPFA